MGRRCCIAGCASTSRLPEHHGVTYHSFPLDAAIRAIWIRNTRLSAERTITKSVLVCSRHFRRADFQPQRSGKYLLKQRVFPTVFPWGKIEAGQIEADVESLKHTAASATPTAAISAYASANEDETKATVEATVAQIMAETAELSASLKGGDGSTIEGGPLVGAALVGGVRFEPVTNFNPGVRLEAQDFDGVWHAARVVEVDNDDREVLIKFERTGKNKSAVVGTEEWIPMNSTRLRQKISTKQIPVFELEEKCMARWSGPRKFPGTIKKILDNDVYEVLFDDGYIKNVRAVHMNKMLSSGVLEPAAASPIPADIPEKAVRVETPVASPVTTPVLKARSSSTASSSRTSMSKKRAAASGRKDWPLLDMSTLDLESLNLPEIPRDGEWTCHWVNDQPIGREGFLIVGEHRKPTVIVDDWRLPPGWVKHMYQRSNVLGKWDVILVTPTNKRFRSKADLKVYLEEQGEVYNPDIYDFSIHRRRAKDINAYAYTPDYTPQQHKLKTPLQTAQSTAVNTPVPTEMTPEETKAALESSLAAASNSSFLETPVASHLPPMELMTSPIKADSADGDARDAGAEMDAEISELTKAAASPLPTSKPTQELTDTPVTAVIPAEGADNSFAFIGGLKVDIVDNLFRCPQTGCAKNFRKENHLQIHVKHYHRHLVKLLGACPKMQELAEKRTFISASDANEPHPKNQIPNQEFFAKLHQQDLEQSRSHRKSSVNIPGTVVKPEIEGEEKMELKQEIASDQLVKQEAHDFQETLLLDASLTSNADETLPTIAHINAPSAVKRNRFSPSKRAQGARKSNRQRTTRHYFTPAPCVPGSIVTADTAVAVTDIEETRHAFNATPEHKFLSENRKRKPNSASATPLSSAADSPITADSGSGSASSFPPQANYEQPLYIKENGELIKIVHMRQEEIINCLCQYGEEDGLMIQCELCLCWQHGICNGIEKESEVPEKYVCYICRNPSKARESMRFKHDQDWLYDGKLPVSNFHIPNPQLPRRFEFLKKSHTLTGNLIDLKRVLYSLKVKINIANNRCHPKLYLWAKKWDDDGGDMSFKLETDDISEVKQEEDGSSPPKRIKSEAEVTPMPNIPQPEAPIDPEECQQRLMEHIKIQQSMVMKRLDDIALEMDELETHDELPDLKDADTKTIKDTLATFIRELDIVKRFAKLNALENSKQTSKSSTVK